MCHWPRSVDKHVPLEEGCLQTWRCGGLKWRGRMRKGWGDNYKVRVNTKVVKKGKGDGKPEEGFPKGRMDRRTYGTTGSFLAMCGFVMSSFSRGSTPSHLLWLLPVLECLSTLLLAAWFPPPLQRQHTDKGGIDWIPHLPSVPSSHLIISVIHKEHACGLALVCMVHVHACVCVQWQGLYRDGRPVHFSVSASQKEGRPLGVVLHFLCVINSPCSPSVFCRDGMAWMEGGT